MQELHLQSQDQPSLCLPMIMWICRLLAQQVNMSSFTFYLMIKFLFVTYALL